MKVLENAPKKIRKYDEYDRSCKGGKYNSAYRKILRARKGELSLIRIDGALSNDSFDIVEQALVAFDMKELGQIDDGFKETFRLKMEKTEIKTLLRDIRKCTILSGIESIECKAETLFEILSEKPGLSAKGLRFGVGAAKIMNFLFPELFVMVDRNVKKALNLPLDSSLNFCNYWYAMIICQRELMEWQQVYTMEILKSLDKKPTTPLRIFDKCAFVMGKFDFNV